MELNDAIKSRRSIRKYKQIDVSDYIIEDLIDFARHGCCKTCFWG